MKKYTYILTVVALLSNFASEAQTCPSSSTTTISSYGNTYYPGAQASVSAGATTITLGNASTSGYGTVPISAFDVVLIIQMQGAQINSTNGTAYGDGTGTGSGYLNNGQLMAGQMEYAVAASAVPLTGGTLTVQSALSNSYKNANYGTDGQYRYQVIRVPLYYNATLGADIKPPGWNGTVGGVIALFVSYALNMNGHKIDASSMGFRGGGGKAYSNVGSGANTDFVAVASNKAGGSKGEGIAGTPLYLDSLNSAALISTGVEGYPGGSYDRGAPGNAGGGATDGAPNPSNSNNAGGGGGGNGGAGGIGGNSWSSNLTTGGRPGAVFAQKTPSRLVMGGGGGSGSSDGGTGTPSGGYASSGAPGGGIVIIIAGSITGTGSILANGAPPNTTLANDGSGGGGAGGSVLIVTGVAAPGLTVNANGSAGASNTGGTPAPGQKHGTGGGGGGGVVYSNKALGAVSVAGGAAGVTTTLAVTYGAAAGAAGVSSQSITISQTPPFPMICNGLLAKESLSGSAISENGKITVSWQATTEEDIRAYTVERSFDGTVFSPISTVAPAVSGNNTGSYSYTDEQAGDRSGLIYYRIEATDIDGRNLFSNIIPVDGSVRFVTLKVTPNPVAGSATLSFTSDHNASVSIRLIDITGNPVWSRQCQAGRGINTVQLDHVRELPNGIYVLQLYDGGNYEKIKMLIRH
ncbi:T9SS type A sorting domain-containing protein [Flavitalea sp. BT771]|uniref:T9SS type A sorting domain-containing protein n=1 Tax=Flavitalea sp. BT771 TaxID=3063329 RepID=UPI0026E2135B|nr:T9SS type A sorting domain-containing protein [Flavitalea sp. BT771]MDO6432893.1 T9SS type A sorting domain-containing protein [Flavitalea sp. BT771]MDV6221831.1 T9SS type A sorting domain-containing protein [Flavitalea sp. BT771]